MRGKLVKVPRGCCFSGITPADAGKTLAGVKFEAVHKDHPRGCGENCLKNLKEQKKMGSPPRMRGKLSPSAASESAARITPADAGKTYSIIALICQYLDHPRGCGENLTR